MQLELGRRYKLLQGGWGFRAEGDILTVNSVVTSVNSNWQRIYTFKETDYAEWFSVAGVKEEKDWFELVPELNVGNLLKSKASGTIYTVTRTASPPKLIRLQPVNGSSPHLASAIDIWNFYEMWPGTQEAAPTSTAKKRCEHKLVNVGFTSLVMACKYCGKSESECDLDNSKRRESLEGV